MRGPLRGSWVFLNSTQPPYTVSHYHDTWDKAHRVGGTCQGRGWKYGWQDAQTAHVAGGGGPFLSSASSLCTQLSGTNMLFIGDSLSLQFYESFRARLRHERYAHGPDAGNAWCRGRCEGPFGRLCGGHCAVPNLDDNPHSSHFSVCDGGAAMMIAEGFRWVVSADSFVASDPQAGRCASRVRRSPSSFGLEVIPKSHVQQMLTAALKPITTPQGVKHPVQRLVVVYNQMAHIHAFIKSVRECYATEGGMSESLAATAAERDVLRFWADDQARWANLLQQLRANLTLNGGARIGGLASPAPRIDVYLRTSPPAADAFCTKPDGSPRTPLTPAVLTNGVMHGAAEYSHHLVHHLNDVMRAAFRAHGHGVVDVEAMLGVRVDAYPCSHDGTGDKLHFCQPGPVDWALDALVRQIRRDA